MKKRLIAILSCFGLIAGMSLFGTGSTSAGATTYNIIDHGGPVLNHTTNIHVLYWGLDGTIPAGDKAEVEALVGGLPGSDSQHVTDEYMRGLQATTTLIFADAKVRNAAAPTNRLNGQQLATVIHQTWPVTDVNGLYVVWTSTKGTADGACAWHDSASVAGIVVPVAYVPDNHGQAACDSGNYFWDQYLPADVPHGYLSGRLDALYHEIQEARTDPLPPCALFCDGTRPPSPYANPAWIDDSLGAGEIADVCGDPYTISGTYPNLVFTPILSTLANGQRFLLQQMWSNNANSCI